MVRAVTPATLVVKRGPLGCTMIDGAVPASIDDAPSLRGVEVEVLNVLGAGDAFASGFLSGWLRDEPLDACARAANACGALVVSRHGCAPAMPTAAELDYFLARTESRSAAHAPARSRRDACASASRQPCPRAWDEVLGFAFDHRPQFFDLAREAGTAEARIADSRVVRRRRCANGMARGLTAASAC